MNTIWILIILSWWALYRSLTTGDIESLICFWGILLLAAILNQGRKNAD